MKTFLTLLFFVFTLTTSAVSNYYPTEYQVSFENKSLRGEELREKLFVLLTWKHIYRRGKNDIINPHCTGSGKCYEHRSIGYRGARKVLFGKIHLEEDSSGYFIQDVYCRKKITRRISPVGPNVIPRNNIMNCEHTWPQSRFNRTFPKDLQKSDLHHLYPTDSRANSIRGNNEFAEVDGDEIDNCEGSYTGVEKWQGAYFEPPNEHKGNVARALFYFAVRYKMKISEQEEDYLRHWHRLDPVDAQERERNEIIHTVQGNRNPFIDYPNLVNDIRDF